jgi:DNA-binding winged helix-turn-helix (wHTH) protein
MSAYEMRDNVRFSGFDSDFRFNCNTLCLYRVDHHGSETLVEMGRRALEVLNVLIEHAPETVVERELLDRVWGKHADKRNLDVQIRNLRRVLEQGAPKERLGCVIRNVPRRGYCFAREVMPFLEEVLPASVGSEALPEVEPIADSTLLLAVIRAATEGLRSFTEDQERTINALKAKLRITARLLDAICAVAMDTGMPLDRLPEEVIKIVRACQQELAKPLPLIRRPGFPDFRPRETIDRLLQELGKVTVVDLQHQANEMYALEASESANNNEVVSIQDSNDREADDTQ